jgi:hypothetical protein
VSDLAARLAEKLAVEVVRHVEQTGDEGAIRAIEQSIGDSSQTLQEAFVIAVRVLRAARRAEALLAARVRDVPVPPGQRG